jgi:hypothetical protein
MVGETQRARLISSSDAAVLSKCTVQTGLEGDAC